MGNHTSAPNKRLEASFYAIQSIKALAKRKDRLKKRKMSPNEAKFHKISLVMQLPVGFKRGNPLNQGKISATTFHQLTIEAVTDLSNP